MILVLSLTFVALGQLILAQSCDNYGVYSTQNGTCTCPPGFGGETCALAACGGTIFQGTSRQYAPIATSGLPFSNITSCGCQDSWSGLGCNVCRASSACQSGYSSVFGNNSSPSGDIPGATNNTIVCNTSPRVYTGGELSCAVVNPTLAAVYPGPATLNIIRNYNTSFALAPNLTSYGGNGVVHAQLFYEGEEQFYCQADSCSVRNDVASSNWICSNLKCVCRGNTSMCGATKVLDLSGPINGLSGTLGISCNNPSSDSGADCSFQQEFLDRIFGQAGLQLSNCLFGECVRQSVIDYTSGGTNSTNTSSSGSSLSGGVIAGIAVVGALILAAFVVLLIGWGLQRRARKNGADSRGDNEGKTAPAAGLQWTNISLRVPSTPSTWGSLFRKKGSAPISIPGGAAQQDELPGYKTILAGVSGHVAAGEMLAILGPSGAGKTSLVDILSGQDKQGLVGGQVSFFVSGNGDDKDTLEQKPRIGYVDQADILPGTLTAYEALLFAARLRLPESMSLAEKKSHVLRVMEQLGLSSLADARIGDERHRGLSGGEKRRLSIGLELVAKPDVLILDEPTSGLDSVSALKVANVLRDLAHDPTSPTTVIASIHQPSSHLYLTFDSVLVLSGGRDLYFGPGGSTPLETLASQGYPPCPSGYSIPDHLLNLASDSEPHSESAAHAAEDSSEAAPRASGVGSRAMLSRGPTSRDGGFSHSAKQRDSPPAATFLTQFEVLCGREWKNLMRDKTLFVTHLLVAVILGVFCGGLYFQIGTSIAGFQSRVGCLFFLGSLLSFSSLSALFNFVEVRSLFLRERASRYYSPAAWLSARIVFDIVPLRLVPTIVVSTIVYWMAGLSPHPDRFFKYLFILVLYSLAMVQFNFALAAVFRNGGIAILLSSLWNLYIMTYAGFFVHLRSIPPVLRWLQYFSVLKYCLEALAINEINSGLQIDDTLQGVPVHVSAVVIMELLFGFDTRNYYRDALVLFAFTAGFAVIGFTFVILKLKERR